LKLPTILVADDNSNIQKMVSLAFEEHGIDVVAVGNGEAAVRRIPDLNPDLVLADVFMPVRNGYEVCEFVKQDPRFSRVPVILLVGAFDPLDENEARRVGADGVLKKPFVPPDPLIAMVTSALEKIPRPVPVSQAAPPQEEVLVSKPVLPTPFVVPESQPEPDDTVFAYGTGRRDLDEEARELPTPLRTETEEQEPEEESGSRWAETAHDWRRNAGMSIEVPENTVADSAEDSMETAAPELTEESVGPEISDLSQQPMETAFSAPAAPEVSSQGSHSGPVEWQDMMASPPPAEHSTSWTPEPEPQTSQTPEAAAFTSQEVGTEISVVHEPEGHEPEETFSPPTTVRPEAEDEISTREETPPVEPPAAEDSFFEPGEAAPLPSREPEFSPVGADSFFTPDEDFRHMPASGSEQAVREEKVEEAHSPAFMEELAKASLQPVIASVQPPDPYLATPETPLLVAPAAGDLSQSSDAHVAPIPSDVPIPVPGEEAASSQDSSDVNVEAAVARVLEKLEPQLHEILSSGVLRPLVENLLQQELKKKH
jgi:CheY-like chemotaxis protein